MNSALVDTSALVAFFDENDKYSRHYHTVFTSIQKSATRLYTTWLCVTEASYFLSPTSHIAMLEWVQRGGVHLYPVEAHHLSTMIPKMKVYTERGKNQMDLADASLYFVATELNTRIVLTLDIRDFNRYRLPDGQAFEIL